MNHPFLYEYSVKAEVKPFIEIKKPPEEIREELELPLTIALAGALFIWIISLGRTK